jgi:hypothetical protein
LNLILSLCFSGRKPSAAKKAETPKEKKSPATPKAKFGHIVLVCRILTVILWACRKSKKEEINSSDDEELKLALLESLHSSQASQQGADAKIEGAVTVPVVSGRRQAAAKAVAKTRQIVSQKHSDSDDDSDGGAGAGDNDSDFDMGKAAASESSDDGEEEEVEEKAQNSWNDDDDEVRLHLVSKTLWFLQQQFSHFLRA